MPMQPISSPGLRRALARMARARLDLEKEGAARLTAPPPVDRADQGGGKAHAAVTDGSLTPREEDTRPAAIRGDLRAESRLASGETAANKAMRAMLEWLTATKGR